MKTERELFEEWFKNKFHDLHEAICCGDLVAKNYKKAMFKAWQARVPEGYKLVPVEINDEIESAMFSSVARGEMPCDIYKAMIQAVEK